MSRPLLAILSLLAAGTTAGCSHPPGLPGTPKPRPSQVTNFTNLYTQNCAGCHGKYGKGGAAISLADPVFLDIASDNDIKTVISHGVAGTPMPAFAQSAGGMLTDQQVADLVQGIRQWARPQALAGTQPPPFSATTRGDPKRGLHVYKTFCSSCHGPDGQGGPKAGSIVDPSYLALTSDQYLRTVVIAGRPDIGQPDWRGDLPGHPLTDQQVTDVVAWLSTQRIHVPGETIPGLQVKTKGAKSE